MNLAISAITVWLFAIGKLSSVWWPLAVWMILAVATIFALRPRVAQLGVTVLLLLSSVTLVWLQFWLVNPVSQTDVHVQAAGLVAGVRDMAANSLVGLNRDSAALTLGLAIGDSSLASEQLLQDMKTVSLTHLVAVSGANCAIVIGAIYFSLRRFSIKTRVFVSLLALTLYAVLVGGSASVLRAAVMAAAFLLAQLTGRKSGAMSILSLSILILLIANPALALSFSFSLSVAATFGILLLAPELSSRFARRLPKPIALALAVSISAQVLCLPILLQLQPGIPVYSILANLICEPLVAPITILGLIAVCLSFTPLLASAIFWLASLFAAIISSTAHFFAALPLAIAPWIEGVFSTAVAIVLVIALIVIVKSRSETVRLLSGLTIVLCLVNSFAAMANSVVKLSTWPQADWQIASCDVGQGDATVVRSGQQVALIDVGRDEAKINNCLSRLGISRIDLLVLTHFDFDHVGGLAGALRNRAIVCAMLTPFKDDRPAAAVTRAEIAASNAQLVYAEAGMVGTIGEATWRVLSPSRTAAEAEDSNDGSITMLFKFSDFTLLTLADLGEKGQMRLAANLRTWYDQFAEKHDLVMKVSHHGSADQYAELVEFLHPAVSLISVGANNGYGHPTQRTLRLLAATRSLICRTDLLGAIAISRKAGSFEISNSGAS